MTDPIRNVPAPAWPPAGGSGVCRSDSAQPPDTTSGAAPDLVAVTAAIRRKYAEVSVSAEGKFAYPTGRDGAEALGYDRDAVTAAPAGILDAFCGVGNPFTLGEIRHGESVLDFGSGGGFDLFVAAGLVGPAGRVSGVDLTPEMAARAKRELHAAGVGNYDIQITEAGRIPYPDEHFDVIISNGVINLSPDKRACFSELFRVLKPGGRLQFADVVRTGELPAEMASNPEAWSQWIGGTIPVGDQMALMAEAGFVGLHYAGASGFRTSLLTEGGLFRAFKPSPQPA